MASWAASTVAGEGAQRAGRVGARAGVEFVGFGGGRDAEGADGAGGALERMGEVGAPARVRHRPFAQAFDDLAGLAVEQAQQLGFEVALAECLPGEVDEVDRPVAGDRRKLGFDAVDRYARRIGHITLHMSLRPRRAGRPLLRSCGEMTESRLISRVCE